MDQPQAPVEEAAPPKRHGSMGMALLAGGVVLASLVGALLYQAKQNQRPLSIDTSGFDVSQVSQTDKPLPAAAAPQAPQQSGLSMISGILPGMAFGKSQRGGGTGAPAAQAQAAQDFTTLCRSNESLVRAMAEDYTRRYPAIRQYGRDWMSYPDLKKLNDDYERNHDPVAFLRGLAASDNFPKLVVKYAREPAIQAFVKDALTHAPQQIMSAGLSYARKDGLVGQLLDKVTGALGLPPGLFGGGHVDANAVMSHMMNANPDVQKALDNPEVQSQLQNQGVNVNQLQQSR